MKQQDHLDQAIISALQNDGTISHRDLAKLCGSSEATIRRHVKRLRKDGVMRIVAVVNPFKRGYPVIAILNLQIDQRQMREVKAILSKMTELRFVGVTVGSFDIVAEAWFRSSEEMLAFISDVLAQVPGIIRIVPLQIHEMVTYAYDWGKPADATDATRRAILPPPAAHDPTSRTPPDTYKKPEGLRPAARTCASRKR